MQRLAWILIVQVCGLAAAQAAQPLEVGSKRFTESYILGEIMTQAARTAGPAEHHEGLGNTAILVSALAEHSIDLYPEYLGTIELEILKHATPSGSLDEVNRDLAPLGLGAAIPFGFENTYALAVRSDLARTLQLRSITDLSAHPELRIGASHEFLGRSDGWAGLKERYGLPQTPIGLDHGLAYAALARGQVDIIDVYSTDARIATDHLVVLKDDRKYFPSYEALVLYRLDLPQRLPEAWSALQALQGRINTGQMIAMNAAAEIEHRPFAAIAADFLSGRAEGRGSARAGLWTIVFGGDFWKLTREHVILVILSVSAALALGIPLGTLAAHAPAIRSPIMLGVGVLQTIPALALLAFLIPVLGQIGTLPALVALFIYALLPIVRNTCVGLLEVPHGLREAGRALGLSARQRLTAIEVPLAGRVILAGLKTATVISVGTATIAAFIGAGGYGQRITVGLALNDNRMLLAGAIPAALLALVVELLFDGCDRALARRVKRSSN
jgi:osmoprotectant transport system permease protein